MFPQMSSRRSRRRRAESSTPPATRRPWTGYSRIFFKPRCGQGGAARLKSFSKGCVLGQATTAATLGELVDRRVLGNLLRWEARDVAAELLHQARNGDAEHALTTVEEVDDLLGGTALVDGRAVGDEGQAGEVIHAEVLQLADCLADVLQGDAGVQQSLDDLQHEDVAEGVQALGTGAGGVADGGLYQVGASPVVELTVSNTCDLACAGQEVTHLIVWPIHLANCIQLSIIRSHNT